MKANTIAARVAILRDVVPTVLLINRAKNTADNRTGNALNLGSKCTIRVSSRLEVFIHELPSSDGTGERDEKTVARLEGKTNTKYIKTRSFDFYKYGAGQSR